MPNPNDRIGEYLLDEKIGAGAFGQVWRAHHHAWTDQLVAIKIPTDSQYLRALQHEGHAIHGLVHPNIVRAIGFDPYAPVPYLTMEYVPGTSLRPLIQKRALKPNDAVAILQQILAGLSYAHTNGIIHRDLKPENILVHTEAAQGAYKTPGMVKITDFGLGKAAAASAGSIAYSASMNDPAGREIAGSLDYMAPEQRSGANVDARADLYACGVILYEMLTGEKPAGTDVPSDLVPAIPKSLDEIFRRSYARLDRRFTNAQEFAAALSSPGPTRTTSSQAEFANAVPCPRCRQPVDRNDQFCMHCGVQMVTTVRRCPQCGSYPDATDRFCIFCGANLVPQPMAV